MKAQLSAEEIMNWWLEKYHGITVQWLVDNEPELIKTPEWYKKYPVTQQQHDEWYNWAIGHITKHYGWSKRYTKRQFMWQYLNLSPTVINK